MDRTTAPQAIRATITDAHWDRMHLLLTVQPVDGVVSPYWALATRQGLVAAVLSARLQADGSWLADLNLTNNGRQAIVDDGVFGLIALTAPAAVGDRLPTAPFATAHWERENLLELSRVFRYRQQQEALTVTLGMDENSDELTICVMAMKRRHHPRRRLLTWLCDGGKSVPHAALHRLKNALLRLTFSVARHTVRHTGKRVLFASESHDRLTGNLLALWERMERRGLTQTYSVSQACYIARDLHGLSRIRQFQLLAKAARADVIFIDDFAPVFNGVSLPASTQLVQVWHAGCGFKAIGYSRFGYPGSPSLKPIMHRAYTWAVCGGKQVAPFFAECFGIDPNRLLPTGLPRLDRFLDPEHRASATAAFYQRHPECRGKRLILFAPTFRGAGQDTASYDYNRLDFEQLYRFCGDQTLILFKMHPFVRTPVPVPPAFGDRLLVLDPGEDINDLFYVTDLLISDYSSNIYEFSLMGRPMLFYAYDLNSYAASRGFHRAYRESAPGKVCTTFSELIDALQTGDFESEKVERFVQENFDHVDSDACDRVLDWVLLGQRPQEPHHD